jgi:hypothetical protein
LDQKIEFFVAALVKSDLVRKVHTMDDRRCRLLCKLLDGNLASLHMPESYASKKSVKNLMTNIGKRCRGLKLFEASICYVYDQTDAQLVPDNDPYDCKWYEKSFFRALPGLVNLQVVQLKHFTCDDQVLQLFALHTKNLV